ncbi:MAG TPA: hypothetical protein VHP36_08090 [Chitinispirillaceae bacterium]|nr:hypothetical protein [Chitinispirillaceae bacterium]
MACSEWDVAGLLYSSKELDVDQEKQFEEHLCICSECKEQLELYEKERTHFFNPTNLLEIPSRKVDEEILRVCSNSRKQFTSFGLLPSFLKKTAFSVTFFVVGFAVVGYFAMNFENSSKGSVVVEKSDVTQPLQTVKSADQDSFFNDSANDSGLYYSKTRGSLDSKGVFPVDLKNK